MNQDIIYIENTGFLDIRITLEQWIELYLDDLDSDLKFKLFKYDKSHTVIELSKEIENKLFNFLMNYLTYPDNKREASSVKGFTQIRDKKIFPSSLLGQPVQIYVSKNDSEYDNVNGVIPSGDTYKIDFGGKIIQMDTELSYSKPAVSYTSSKLEIIGINKEKISKKNDDVDLAKFEKRFLWISIIYFFSFLISIYITQNTSDFDTTISVFTFALAFWAILEEKLLRFDTVYFKLLVLSIFVGGLGYYLSFELQENFWSVITRLPFFFLISFRFLRFLYVKRYNREPVYEKNAKLIEDKIFSILLTLVAFLLTFLI
ncbi:hypothetical protein ERX46_04040 [Brumimicrobium glaciale]|uniref:Uncharacterized protein n=1 Tax=Brumimicrobium glaciale TaxID=200475 RepID=A0A4Q4KMK8_9FLAO|nr:hypothetical protein [Brumimicrobium glaciale]RYM34552.1 hypothetical protein ERX46_04040 [Brumimicrobium glaciale]